MLLKELHCNNVVVNGDLKNMIKLLKGTSSPWWELSSMVEEARGVLDQVMDLAIVHNFREANAMVDRLANDVVVLSGR